MTEIICKKIIETTRHIKSEAWTMKELDIVLQNLKKGKCRDPQGLMNEIFKPDVIGENLKIFFFRYAQQNQIRINNTRYDENC